MNGHLGTNAAAFVDGELDYAGRERALEHLARCGQCRALVEHERWVKSRVQTLPGAEPSASLLSSLTDVTAVPPPEPPRPWYLPHGHLRRGGFLVAGVGTFAAGFLGVAYAVGGVAAEPTPVSPPVDRFSAEFAGSQQPLPFSDPASDVLPVIVDRPPPGGGR